MNFDDESEDETEENDEDDDDDFIFDVDDDEDDNESSETQNDETDDSFLNFDDEESNDAEEEQSDEEDSDDLFNFDDEEETSDNNEIANLDDLDVSNEDEEDSDDLFNFDDEEETSDDNEIADLDDLDVSNDDEEDSDESDNDDFIFDVDDDDESDEDIKIDDKPLDNITSNVNSGIANKNYNPNYDISKQLNEINGVAGDETDLMGNSSTPNNQMVKVADMDMINIGDGQKVVAFVGSHNSGNSFIVNNLAQLLSEQGVKTAIVDLTKNKNSYYIYTENEEALRNIAYSSFEKLKSGIADGIKVNKNLTVYTALPNSDAEIDDKANAMTTLLNNYSLVLLDCDFDTGLEFFNIAQDIYFVQTFDILTIQAMTSFIKKLKMNKVDYENKMKIIVNKHVNLGTITERAIVAALSVYNSPDTTYQLDLFDRNSVEYFTIPFEEKNYCKYLEEVVKCKLTIRGYSKSLLNSLNKLAKSVYPINGKKAKNK